MTQEELDAMMDGDIFLREFRDIQTTNGHAYLRNGWTSNAEVKLFLGGRINTLDFSRFNRPVFYNKGLYVDIPNSDVTVSVAYIPYRES